MANSPPRPRYLLVTLNNNLPSVKHRAAVVFLHSPFGPSPSILVTVLRYHERPHDSHYGHDYRNVTTTRSAIKAARVTRFTTIAKIPANLPKAFLITSANAEGHGARRRFLRMRSSA